MPIQDCVTIIKDLFAIIFTATASFLGVLTYLNVRKTILQPIRNEVVKKQSAVLSELLEAISKDPIVSFDYIDLVGLNVYSVLINYGFYFSNHEELEESLKSKTCSRIPCGTSDILKNFKLSQPFETEEEREKDKRESFELQKKEYEKAKNEGIINIEEIVTTKDHDLFCKRLRDFIDNPFMPSSIQDSLKDLLHTANINLTVHLMETLKEFAAEYFKNYSSDDKPDFSVMGVWNKYNHKRFHHREQFNDVRMAIRKHLRIDDTW